MDNKKEEKHCRIGSLDRWCAPAKKVEYYNEQKRVRMYLRRLKMKNKQTIRH